VRRRRAFLPPTWSMSAIASLNVVAIAGRRAAPPASTPARMKKASYSVNPKQLRTERSVRLNAFDRLKAGPDATRNAYRYTRPHFSSTVAVVSLDPLVAAPVALIESRSAA